MVDKTQTENNAATDEQKFSTTPAGEATKKIDDAVSKKTSTAPVVANDAPTDAVDKEAYAISKSQEEKVKPPSPEDRVASARERMEASKNEWRDKDIHFKMEGSGKSKYVGCSTRRIGVAHIIKGKKDGKDCPCQDYSLVFSHPKKDLTLVAVADGHGDSKHDLSEQGSQIACEQLKAFVTEIIEETKSLNIDYFTSVDFKKSLVMRWEKAVLADYEEKRAKDTEENTDKNRIISRYGTTLLFAFSHDGFYVVGQLGDGGIVLLNSVDKKCRIHKPIPNKKVGGGTASMCMDYADAFIDMKIYPVEDCEGIVLMTDGYYDLWESEDKLIEAARALVKALADNKDNPTKVESELKTKYNNAVEFVSDDISIGVLVPTNGVSKKTSSYPPVSRTHSSSNRTIYDTEFSGSNLRALFLNQHKPRAEQGVLCSLNNVDNVEIPYITQPIMNSTCYAFPQIPGNYMTLDDYCEDYIVNKRYGMDRLQAISLLVKILRTIKDAEALFEKDNISLKELLNIIEFSIERNTVKIYRTYPQLKKNAASRVGVIARYILNFLAAGRLFYDDEHKEDALELINNESRACIHQTNLAKYPTEYVEFMKNAMNPKTKIAVEDLLQKTIELQRRYVYCADCGRVFLCGDDRKFHCEKCTKSFEIVDFLKNGDTIVPLSANAQIRLWNDKTQQYENAAEVIAHPKDPNIYGLKNLSTDAWKKKECGGVDKDITPGDICDYSNAISLCVFGEDYEIERAEVNKNAKTK